MGLVAYISVQPKAHFAETNGWNALGKCPQCESKQIMNAEGKERAYQENGRSVPHSQQKSIGMLWYCKDCGYIEKQV